MKRAMLWSGTLLVMAAPVMAQEQPVAPEAATSATDDPQRDALADQVALRLWPDGTVRRQMAATFSNMIDAMLGSVDGMAAASASEIYGKNSKQARRAANPHAAVGGRPRADQMRLFTEALGEEMTPLLEEVEPLMRSGVSHALARRYNASELAELDTVLATPAGSRLAADLFLILGDSEVTASSLSVMPELMRQMPQMAQRAAERAGIELPEASETVAAEAVARKM